MAECESCGTSNSDRFKVFGCARIFAKTEMRNTQIKRHYSCGL